MQIPNSAKGLFMNYVMQLGGEEGVIIFVMECHEGGRGVERTVA